MIRPVTTEKAVRLIELNNTICFESSMNDTKAMIKKEVEEAFKVKVESVNSVIKANKKVFFVKLNEKNPAIDIATKLGMI